MQQNHVKCIDVRRHSFTQSISPTLSIHYRPVINNTDGQTWTARVFYLLAGVSICFLWYVVCDDLILMQLSTLEIRSSFISVFLFIDSILRNSATINTNQIKDGKEEPLWRTSVHLEEVFLFRSMIGSD